MIAESGNCEIEQLPVFQLLNLKSAIRQADFISAIHMDSAEQLQRIYLAGFELQTFDRFPRAIGVIKDGCIALLEATPEGLRMIGTPGWRMGEVMGVLVERDGRQVFQSKEQVEEATEERLDALGKFRAELDRLMRAPA